MSSLNFSLILILAEGFAWMRKRASLRVASGEVPAGSILSLLASATRLLSSVFLKIHALQGYPIASCCWTGGLTGLYRQRETILAV